MAILTLQRRARELGRIRIGQVVKGSNGKSRPEKLDRFRLTSASEPLLQQVAALYGGTVTPWTPANGGTAQFEVVTTSTRLPVLVPPQPVSQYFELWSGGGCQRRCDGERELLSDRPCLCDPDPEDRECKPTTRLNVILRDVPGLGVWRLESHGYYAAVELPQVAELLARAQDYVEAHLGLEERVVKREGKTKRFMVPTIEVAVTPAALMAGGQAPAVGAGRTALPAAPAALAGKPAMTDEQQAQVIEGLPAVDTLGALQALWRDLAREFALSDDVKTAMTTRADQLGAAPSASTVADADAMWQRVLATIPPDWSTTQAEEHFEQLTGVPSADATAEDMQRYLTAVAA